MMEEYYGLIQVMGSKEEIRKAVRFLKRKASPITKPILIRVTDKPSIPDEQKTMTQFT